MYLLWRVEYFVCENFQAGSNLQGLRKLQDVVGQRARRQRNRRKHRDATDVTASKGQGLFEAIKARKTAASVGSDGRINRCCSSVLLKCNPALLSC